MKSKNEILRISLFFDGGTNDAFDKDKYTQIPIKCAVVVPDHDILQTNIYRLFYNLQRKKDKHNKCVYVSGSTTVAGTASRLSDSINDFDQCKANSKTQIALFNFLDVLKKYCVEHSNTDVSLKIDLFGFSSGAALARNFANLLNNDQDIKDEIICILRKNDNVLREITFGFIGLFDTIKTDLGNPAHTTINLDLNGIKADATFHLTALHEFRENFPLLSVTNMKHHATSIDVDTFGSSSNRVTNTFEFALPGSHNDIGGGYNLFEDEDTIINHKPTYIAAGLTESIQNIIDTNSLLAPLLSSVKFEYNIFRGGYTAINRRRNVYGHLQLLYARLMVDTAAKFGVPFDLSQFEIAHPVPTELKYFYGKLIDSRNLLLNVKRFTSPTTILDTQLVQKYVHLSASARTSVEKANTNIKLSLHSKSSKSKNYLFRINNATADWKRKIYRYNSITSLG